MSIIGLVRSTINNHMSSKGITNSSSRQLETGILLSITARAFAHKRSSARLHFLTLFSIRKIHLFPIGLQPNKGQKQAKSHAKSNIYAPAIFCVHFLTNFLETGCSNKWTNRQGKKATFPATHAGATENLACSAVARSSETFALVTRAPITYAPFPYAPDTYAAALSAAALSVRSQVNSGSSRPKWP